MITHTTSVQPTTTTSSNASELSLGKPRISFSARRKMMPEPGNLYDARWKILPPSLQNTTLSRFDQTKCVHNHQISERGMCAGLSISWLKMMSKGDQDMSPRQSIERMSHLASFDEVVKARVAQNYYLSEHKFRVEDEAARPEEYRHQSRIDLMNGSLMEAAKEMGNMDLKVQLCNGKDLTFPMMTPDQNGEWQDDPDALQALTKAVADSQQGVLGLYSSEGSHAIAFHKQPDSDAILLFDPNHGEFATTLKDFQATLADLNYVTDITPTFAQVFAQSKA